MKWCSYRIKVRITGLIVRLICRERRAIRISPHSDNLENKSVELGLRERKKKFEENKFKDLRKRKNELEDGDFKYFINKVKISPLIKHPTLQ